MVIVLACAGKIFGTTVAAKAFSHSMRESLTLGILMNTKVFQNKTLFPSLLLLHSCLLFLFYFSFHHSHASLLIFGIGISGTYCFKHWPGCGCAESGALQCIYYSKRTKGGRDD